MISRAAGAAGALVLATNAFVLTTVAIDRAGEAESMVELTARELPIGWGGRENTGIELRLTWMMDTADWLDEAKARELGYGLSSRGSGSSEQREALIVLEMDGPAWRRWLAFREAEALRQTVPQAMENFERDRQTMTRLFAVDAGRDAHSLRQRYPDRGRYIVAPGLVRFWPNSTAPDGKRIWGAVERLLVPAVHVPLPEAARFPALREGDWYASTARGLEPRYSVTLRYGPRLEPSVAGVKFR